MRHTVTSVRAATSFVEEDLRSADGRSAVDREYHGLRGGGSDGWITVVALRNGTGAAADRRDGRTAVGGVRVARVSAAGFGDEQFVDATVRRGRIVGGGQSLVRNAQSAGFERTLGPTASSDPGRAGYPLVLLLVGLSAVPAIALSKGRFRPGHDEAWRDALLVVVLVGLVLGVRTAGIVVENRLPGVDPKYFGLVLYPTLAVGPLAAVRAFAPGRPQLRIAVLAAVGLGAGIVLDLGTVGVSTVPVDVALHRIALVGALALVAAGTSRGDRPLTAVGVVTWVLALAIPLAGLV